MALGGVGEAMLFGAALGAGTTAITNPDAKLKDYLKSAAIGAGTGYLGGGGISNLLAGNPTANILASGATAGQEAAALTQAGSNFVGPGQSLAANTNAGIPALLPGGSGSVLPTGYEQVFGPDQTAFAKLMNPELGSLPTGSPILPASPTPTPSFTMPPSFDPTTGAQVGGFDRIPVGAMSPASSGSATALSDFMSSGAPQAPSVPGVTAPKMFQSTPTSLFDDPLKYAKENKNMAISSMVGSAAAQTPRKLKLEEEEEYKSPYIWRNPLDRYRFASGGIASLPGYDMMVGETPLYAGGGGVSDLGSYSDGGRMLRGAGDGMSDSIPGVIAGKRPARLADSEFVVPADVVSHLGNGSTDAGAKQLYKMMDRVRVARTGTKKQGRQINPMKYLPA